MLWVFKPKSNFTVFGGIFNRWLLSHHKKEKRPRLGFERMGLIAFAFMAKVTAGVTVATGVSRL